jgi:hypothetical protein
VTDEFIRSTYTRNTAGDPKDIQLNWENYLKTYAPRTYLSMAFGQTATGGYSTQTGGVHGVPDFEVGSYSDNSPIVQTLKALGFAPDAIHKIANQINAKDPEDFVKWLTSLMGIGKGYKDLMDNLSLDRAGVYALLDKRGDQSASGLFDQRRADLIDQFGALSSFGGDERVSRTQAAIDAANKFWEDQLAYIQKLRDLQKQLDDETKALFKKWDDFGKTQNEILLANAAIVDGADAKISGSKTPEEAAQTYREAMAAADAMFNVLQQRIAEAKALLADNAQLTTMFSGNNVYAAADNASKSPLEQFMSPSWMNEFRTAWTAIQKETDPDKQIAGIRDIQSAARARYEQELQLIGQIKSSLQSITRGIQGDVQSIWETLHKDDPAALTENIEQRLNDARTRLNSAKSPEEVEYWSTQIRQLTMQWFHMFDNASPEEQTRAGNYATTILNETETMVTNKMGAFLTSLTSSNDEIRLTLVAAGGILRTAVDDASTDIGRLKVSINLLKDLVDFEFTSTVDALITNNGLLATAVYNAQQSFLAMGDPATGVPASSQKVQTSFDQTADAADRLKARFDALFPDGGPVVTPPNSTAGPTSYTSGNDGKAALTVAKYSPWALNSGLGQ